MDTNKTQTNDSGGLTFIQGLRFLLAEKIPAWNPALLKRLLVVAYKLEKLQHKLESVDLDPTNFFEGVLQDVHDLILYRYADYSDFEERWFDFWHDQTACKEPFPTVFDPEPCLLFLKSLDNHIAALGPVKVPSAPMPSGDSANNFGVSLSADSKTVKISMVPDHFTPAQAINLAAWIVALVDPRLQETCRLMDEIHKS